MHKQSPPFIFRSPAHDFPDKAGISGWVPLIESGISIHTLTLRGFVTLDVYTCGELPVRETLSFIRKKFSPARMAYNTLLRGEHYHARKGPTSKKAGCRH